MICKGRQRIKRGITTNFYDLPLDKQLTFKKIKNALSMHLNKSVDVYIFGSYLKGYWDEESDYDIIINDSCNSNLQKQLSKELNIKVEIRCQKNASTAYKALLIPD